MNAISYICTHIEYNMAKDVILKRAKIEDLIPDDKNFNKGSQYGKSLMNKSLSKFGAGRSVLIDKNNRIIAGNKTAEEFAEIGLENVQIVETDGKTLIAVKRNDIDLDTPQGREFALADNQTALKNIVIDAELVEAELSEVVCEEWGVENFNTSDIDINKFFEESNEQKEQKNKIVLEYTEEDYNLVIDAFSKQSGSKEQIVFKFNQINA